MPGSTKNSDSEKAASGNLQPSPCRQWEVTASKDFSTGFSYPPFSLVTESSGLHLLLWQPDWGANEGAHHDFRESRAYTAAEPAETIRGTNGQRTFLPARRQRRRHWPEAYRTSCGRTCRMYGFRRYHHSATEIPPESHRLRSARGGRPGRASASNLYRSPHPPCRPRIRHRCICDRAGNSLV